MSDFLQHLINGLSLGSVYALIALGYTLVYGVLQLINFAHGAVFTLGAYLTYALTGSQFGINGLLANASLGIRLPFPMLKLSNPFRRYGIQRGIGVLPPIPSARISR